MPIQMSAKFGKSEKKQKKKILFLVLEKEKKANNKCQI